MKRTLCFVFLLIVFIPLITLLMGSKPLSARTACWWRGAPQCPDRATDRDRRTPPYHDAGVLDPNFEWSIVPSTDWSESYNLSYSERAIHQHRRYGLVNNSAPRSYPSTYVVFGEREYGINLVWWNPSFPSVENPVLNGVGFKARGLEPGATIYPYIRSEEIYTRPIDEAWERSWAYRVAIHIGGGSYLCYGEREYGINLVWSNEPCYEWELRQVSGDACPGECPPFAEQEHYLGIGLDNDVGIYNTVTRQYLVFQEREYGISLGWRNP